MNLISRCKLLPALRRDGYGRRQFLGIAGLVTIAPPLLVGCLGNGESAATIDEVTIAEGRAAIDELMAETRATAVSVALVDDTRLIWSEAFGVVDPASLRRATTDTLFPVGSLAKIVGTLAVLMLVDRRRLVLDAPVADYIDAGSFAMPLDPRYRQITVRMLLNHTSGFPGQDGRNAASGTPYAHYAADLMANLQWQRLTHAPGALANYNNDGFTMVENLVRAVAGVDCLTFVRDNLFAPLAITRSRFQDTSLPPDTYAHSYLGDQEQFFFCNNLYIGGGLYAAPEEYARILMVLLGEGRYGGRQLLSPGSIAAMALDQTVDTYNPLPCESFRYGLAWDTVAQPGFAPWSIRALGKTGDMPGRFGAYALVLPDERLGIVVAGVSNDFSSDGAARIAERTLLRALAERGRIAAMPKRLAPDPLPKVNVPDVERRAFAGDYASTGSSLCQLRFTTANSVTLEQRQGGTWEQLYRDLWRRSDGWYAADGDPVTALRPFEADGRQYIALRRARGMRHYTTVGLIAEQLEPRTPLANPWDALRGQTWLAVNDEQAFTSFLAGGDGAPDPRAVFATDNVPQGYALGPGGGLLRNAEPADPTRFDGTFLRLPYAGAEGMNVREAALEVRGSGDAWLRSGSYLYRPKATVPVLGSREVITIDAEGLGEYRAIDSRGLLAIGAPPATTWMLYANDFTTRRWGRGSAADIEVEPGDMLLVFGAPGSTLQLSFVMVGRV